MKRWIQIVRLFAGLFRVARNPNNTTAALTMAERLQDLGLLEAEMLHLARDPEARVVIQNRKLMGKIDLHQLNRLPKGTLGEVYSSHMLALGLDPEFYKMLEIKDDIAFCMMRLRQTHDLWHVMTGFQTSVPGELGLQAFMLAQTSTPLAPLLIGGRLFVVAIKDPREVLLIVDAVARGWIMGQRARPLFALDWEKHWEMPLSQLQSDYLGTGLPALSLVQPHSENQCVPAVER